MISSYSIALATYHNYHTSHRVLNTPRDRALLSSEHVHSERSCWRCRMFNLTSKRAYVHIPWKTCFAVSRLNQKKSHMIMIS